MRGSDYRGLVFFRRGGYTVLSRRWEKQFAIFKNGTCVHIENDRASVYKWLKGQKNEQAQQP